MTENVLMCVLRVSADMESVNLRVKVSAVFVMMVFLGMKVPAKTLTNVIQQKTCVQKDSVLTLKAPSTATVRMVTETLKELVLTLTSVRRELFVRSSASTPRVPTSAAAGRATHLSQNPEDLAQTLMNATSILPSASRAARTWPGGSSAPVARGTVPIQRTRPSVCGPGVSP